MKILAKRLLRLIQKKSKKVALATLRKNYQRVHFVKDVVQLNWRAYVSKLDR